MAPGRLTYEFGDFRLDAARRLLLLKSGARALPLTSRAFDTLLYLVEHPGKLLNKATLMSAIWPDVVVEENSLNQNISLLRRVLGERPGEYRFIVTVPGRGYRFVAEVRTINEATDESKSLVAVREARAQLAMRDGRFVEAAQELTETLSCASRAAGGFEAIQSFYRAQSDPSRTPRAIMALQAWEAKLQQEDLDRCAAQRLIVWFTMLGAIEIAHDVAQRTVDRLALHGTIGSGWGFLWTKEMHAFRDSPGFQHLLARLGLFGYWRQYGPPDNCVLRGDLLSSL